MTRVELQDPINRPTGWYSIMRRLKGGKFTTRETAMWFKKYDKDYGEWTYQNGDSRVISERLTDDLVLSTMEI